MKANLSFATLVTAGCLALVGAITAAVSTGAVSIPPATVWGVAINKLVPGLVEASWSAGRESIVLDVRFPRALLAALVGAGLAVVGAALQSATRNPLADPHLLGVSSGAALGAIVALLQTGLFLGVATVPILAFCGALAATMLVVGVAQATRSASAEKFVLAGVAVSFVLSALGSLLIFLGDPRAAHTVVFWMLGGLGLAQWQHLPYAGLALVLCGGYLLLRSRDLNALAMGDETATTLGIAVMRLRLSVFVATALLTGVMVAFSGAIGFVGLMAPHAARRLVGSDNLQVIPLAALLGALALVLADLAARTVVAPEDLPVGVITGLVGGCLFVLLLRK